MAWCSPALACADDEALLSSCQTQDEAHVIRLCAVRDKAAGCDAETPLGKAACADNPPAVK